MPGRPNGLGRTAGSRLYPVSRRPVGKGAWLALAEAGMTKDEATSLLAAVLREVAPDVDLSAVDPGLPLQEVVDIDSVDFLTLAAAVHDQAGIDIPFRDYPKLATLDLFVSYLMSAPGAG